VLDMHRRTPRRSEKNKGYFPLFFRAFIGFRHQKAWRTQVGALLRFTGPGPPSGTRMSSVPTKVAYNAFLCVPTSSLLTWALVNVVPIPGKSSTWQGSTAASCAQSLIVCEEDPRKFDIIRDELQYPNVCAGGRATAMG